MYVMEQHLAQLRQTGLVTVVDGKPLAIGSHSKDPDCAWGRAGRSYAKGALRQVWGLLWFGVSERVQDTGTKVLKVRHSEGPPEDGA